MKTPIVLLVFLAASAASVHAQTADLSRADSALVGQILLAEDARDSLHSALAEGARHRDARVRSLSVRARERIRDPLFSRRDSIEQIASPPPPVYPEPAWRLRLRGLTAQRSDCGALLTAMQDSAWPVRLRAMDLIGPACESDNRVATALETHIRNLPADTRMRTAGNVSWHAAAHALVALARVNPSAATTHISRLLSHPQPELREYVARAAAQLRDSASLRALAQGGDPNVLATTIDALRRITEHADDSLFLRLLDNSAPQVVRSAALALAGSPRADVAVHARMLFRRWSLFGNAPLRDVRHALLRAAGMDTSQDVKLPPRVALPPYAVALALGEDIRVRVTMSSASGGGSFVVRMRGDAAPMMAATILELVDNSYYDGLTWHRVEHDFVIQGGSPGANEYVGYPHYLRDATGRVPHLRGTVGMSTRGHDTGDAQWFVNLRDNLRLNRDYTVFAEVTEGIEVVDGIIEGDVIASMRVLPVVRR